MINKIGDDLLVEILIRSFPDLKSALRCKTVCKRWSSLISDPRFNRGFVYRHRSISELQPPLLLPSDDPQSIIRSFVPVPDSDNQPLVVLDSFKDLLLCGFERPKYGRGELHRLYFVCNPFTKQWIALPLAPQRWRPEIFFARLVCEPRISNNLDLGDDGEVFVYSSEYRFRVVCTYNDADCIRLDVFCSESGEWIEDALIVDGHHICGLNVVSCGGELFWVCAETPDYEDIDGWESLTPVLVACDPFRLDMPLTRIDFPAKSWEDISVSQGALHVIVSGGGAEGVGLTSVWRLEENRESWRKLCVGVLKTSRLSSFAPGGIFFPSLHPQNPEIVFFYYSDDDKPERVILSCDLRTGEEQGPFAESSPLFPRWELFQCKVSYWATPIPRYEELRGMYDESHGCLVQGSSSNNSFSDKAADQAVCWVTSMQSRLFRVVGRFGVVIPFVIILFLNA